MGRCPAYFYGPACPVQGVAQAIGGTVTHVQLLVDGKVLLDQTPSGQSSVTVTASFDALTFAEGYTLPVTMLVTDSTGHHYDCTLKAVVHLPQVQFYDLWTPDYTAAPVKGQVPQAAATTGGTMGGNTTLHLRSQYGALTLTEVRLHLHRDTDATQDTVFPSPIMASPVQTTPGPPAAYSLWDVRCADPDPSLPTTLPVSQYLNEPWNVGGRNGVYDVTATFTAVGAGGVVHTLTSAATFDREDLLITSTVPANPTPLLWDPTASSSLPLSANFTCAYKQSGTATVKIYTSDQTLVRILTTGFTTKDGSVSLTWDGTADPVNGHQIVFRPNACRPTLGKNRHRKVRSHWIACRVRIPAEMGCHAPSCYEIGPSADAGHFFNMDFDNGLSIDGNRQCEAVFVLQCQQAEVRPGFEKGTGESFSRFRGGLGCRCLAAIGDGNRRKQTIGQAACEDRHRRPFAERSCRHSGLSGLEMGVGR